MAGIYEKKKNETVELGYLNMLYTAAIGFIRTIK